MKEKIINILINELNYCYCDNCEYNDYQKYGDKYCDGCYRKYQNWRLSSDTAAQIAEQIIKEIKEELYTFEKSFEDFIEKVNSIGNINPISANELKEIIKDAK